MNSHVFCSSSTYKTLIWHQQRFDCQIKAKRMGSKYGHIKPTYSSSITFKIVSLNSPLLVICWLLLSTSPSFYRDSSEYNVLRIERHLINPLYVTVIRVLKVNPVGALISPNCAKCLLFYHSNVGRIWMWQEREGWFVAGMNKDQVENHDRYSLLYRSPTFPSVWSYFSWLLIWLDQISPDQYYK